MIFRAVDRRRTRLPGCPYASYVFLSCGSVTEEEGREICHRMHARGCRFIVATRGSKGALVYDGHDFYSQPPHLVEAIDTLGAGDSFATAFLLSLTQSRKEYRERMDSDRKLYRQQLKEAMGKRSFFCSGHVSGTGSIWTWQSFLN